MNFYWKVAFLLVIVVLWADIIWRSTLTVDKSRVTKAVAICLVVVLVAVLSYKPLYTQFRDEREIPNNRAYFIRYGLPKPFVIDDSVSPPRIVGGYAKTRVIVDGRLLTKYAEKFQLIAVVMHWRDAIPAIDEPGISKSDPVDISAQDIEIPILYNDQFIREVLTGSYSESFVLLAVRPGTKPSQFDTVRQAEDLGAKIIAEASDVGAPAIKGKTDPYANEIEDPNKP